MQLDIKEKHRYICNLILRRNTGTYATWSYGETQVHMQLDIKEKHRYKYKLKHRYIFNLTFWRTTGKYSTCYTLHIPRGTYSTWPSGKTQAHIQLDIMKSHRYIFNHIQLEFMEKKRYAFNLTLWRGIQLDLLEKYRTIFNLTLWRSTGTLSTWTYGEK
jgi:hypothetical protein